MGSLSEEILAVFQKRFGQSPVCWAQAPGRINLLGEHTDYNQGFVLPAAISYYTIAAIGPAKVSCAHALLDGLEVNPEVSPNTSKPGWAQYLHGMYTLLVRAGMKPKPFNLVFGGNIPPGAGLSSSASLSCCIGEVLASWHQFDLSRQQLVDLAQQNEHEFIGVKCGIMDMFASVNGLENKALFLDCRTLICEPVPVPTTTTTFFLIDTKVKHALVDSAYNERRAQCEAGVKALKEIFPQVNALRDAITEMISEVAHLLNPQQIKRCRYVIEENDRVQQVVAMLKAGEMDQVGKVMFETHEGLSRLYEVSCEEADFLVAKLAETPGVMGARMMGGGFGGCVLVLAERNRLTEIVSEVSGEYQKQFAKPPGIYQFAITNGCHSWHS